MNAVGATRADAKRRGLKLYRAPTPCKRGHDSIRYTSSAQCVACTRANFDELKLRPRPRGPKPAAAVKAPEPVEAEGPKGTAAYRYKHGYYSDPGNRISRERIDACIERVFGNAPRIGHERQSEAA